METEQVIHAVDGDRHFLAGLERMLRTLAVPVHGYTHARDFLDRLDPALPGCLITDLCVSDMGGLELQSSLKARKIRLPIIFISGYGDTSQAVAALKGGALDFLEKPFSELALLTSVRQALDRDADDRRLAREQTIVNQRYANLTPREQEIFALVVSDLPTKVIARQLKISPRTVEHHREHVRLKMQARSVTELITMAVLCGIRELHL